MDSAKSRKGIDVAKNRAPSRKETMKGGKRDEGGEERRENEQGSLSLVS